MAAQEDGVVVDLAARRRAEPRSERVEAPASTPLLRAVYGEVLRDERLDQDRTLAEVATEVGMSKQYLSEIERGRKEPSSEMLHSICGALGLPIESLLFRGARRLGAIRRLHPRKISETRVQMLALVA
ncbi:helix-turn-helix domain-containing protein [Nocardia brasiliensis]|uniref:Helix-turn-helix domain-containing protein n=1 Tax=Nocardia brasiliensis TaxID=37326 RepID=A0A6G9XXH6_NOCBR|nr:helix-turn-helix transcriptional regulator [Nocardia brasiliensis]QIS05645.1 helix-turn-helix domain-containing protein [Nocardia brasiliensis]